MTKNNVLDFIMKQIQWGNIKTGEKFFSERQLSIKFGVSQSTAKNALQTAEALGLLSSIKGKGRIVEDFEQNINITSYLNTNKSNLVVKKKFAEEFNKEEWKTVKKYSITKDKKWILVLYLYYKDVFVARLFSISYRKELYDTFLKKDISFTDSLKTAEILIYKITKVLFFENDSPVIKRLIFSDQEELIEESYLEINKDFLIINLKNTYPFSD